MFISPFNFNCCRVFKQFFYEKQVGYNWRKSSQFDNFTGSNSLMVLTVHQFWSLVFYAFIKLYEFSVYVCMYIITWFFYVHNFPWESKERVCNLKVRFFVVSVGFSRSRILRSVVSKFGSICAIFIIENVVLHNLFLFIILFSTGEKIKA